MVQPQQGVSLDPETFSEGGGPPVQKNLRVTSAKFDYFTYPTTGNRTFAILVDLVDDGGTVYHQTYSVGDPTRWTHSPDHKFAVAMVPGASITKQCNAGILLTALANAGFSKQALASGDITQINNLYAYWDGVPEPESRSQMRSSAGIGEQQQQRGPRVVLVPMQILEQAGGAPAAGAVAAPPPPPQAPPIPAQAPPGMTPPPPLGSVPGTGTSGPANGATSQVIATAEKVAAATGGVFNLSQLFPQIQADYPNEAMAIMPQAQSVLTANGYLVDAQGNVSRSG